MRLEWATVWCEDCGAEVDVCRVHWWRLDRPLAVVRAIVRVLLAGCGLTASLYGLRLAAIGVWEGGVPAEAIQFYRALLSGGLRELMICAGWLWGVGVLFGADQVIGRLAEVFCNRRAVRFYRRLFNRIFGLRGQYWSFRGELLICARCGSERLQPAPRGEFDEVLTSVRRCGDLYQNLRLLGGSLKRWERRMKTVVKLHPTVARRVVKRGVGS